MTRLYLLTGYAPRKYDELSLSMYDSRRLHWQHIHDMAYLDLKSCHRTSIEQGQAKGTCKHVSPSKTQIRLRDSAG